MGKRNIDQLGKFLIIAGVIFVILYAVLKSHYCFMIGAAAIIFQIYRLSSKDFYKRKRENDKYLEIVASFKKDKKSKKTYNTQHDTVNYMFFNCPHCNQKMRAPKGKGRIRVNCTKCGETFETEV